MGERVFISEPLWSQARLTRRVAIAWFLGLATMLAALPVAAHAFRLIAPEM
jgi:hypothetical protein